MLDIESYMATLYSPVPGAVRHTRSRYQYSRHVKLDLVSSLIVILPSRTQHGVRCEVVNFLFVVVVRPYVSHMFRPSVSLNYIIS